MMDNEDTEHGYTRDIYTWAHRSFTLYINAAHHTTILSSIPVISIKPYILYYYFIKLNFEMYDALNNTYWVASMVV